MSGTPLPLSFHDIEAWSRVTGRSLSAWELDAVLRLDDAWLAAQNGEG